MGEKISRGPLRVFSPWHSMTAGSVIGILLLLVPFTAGARPDYARKEGRACQYCHVSASPGSFDRATGKRETTARNERGQYYAAHNYSFEGYLERVTTGRPRMPSFRYLWKIDFSDLPRRIAVADVTGDGQPRLIMLHEKPGAKDAAVLTVRRWNGTEFVIEFTADVNAPPTGMQAGHFAGKNRPAVIVTGDALWSWNGKTFLRTPAPATLPLFGAARLKTGEDRLLLAETPQRVVAHQVQLTGDRWLSAPMDPPAPTQVLREDMHATPDFFDRMEMPPLLGSGGIIGLWDIRQDGLLALYHVRLDQDFDIKPDTQKSGQPQFILKAEYYAVALLDARSTLGVPFWTTPRLDTRPLDIALQSPREDRRPGLLILTAEPKDGKMRTLHFFGLE